MEMWLLGYVVGALPLLWCLLWWWNELRYVLLPLKLLPGNGGSSKAKLPPGTTGLPIFGELLTFLYYFKIVRRPDDFINSKRQKYGDGVGMYRTYLFGKPSIVTYAPDTNKFIFKLSDDLILQWPSAELLGRTSLVAVHGEPHSRVRKFVINSISRPEALSVLALRVQPTLVAALTSWAEKGQIVARAETKKVTFDNITKIFASFEDRGLRDEMAKLYDGLLEGFRANAIKFPGTAYHHAVKCRKRLDGIFMEELLKRKNSKGDYQKNDLMDGLMKIRDEDGGQLTDREIVENITSLVIGGYESTAVASMWALYHLAKYPDVLAKLREENVAISRSKQSEFLAHEDVLRLKYTTRVVEETVRLTNVSALIVRTATKDVEFKGYKIPKGWRVILFLRYLHTNPENFDDPMCFNPDRWNEPAKVKKAFQAFGGGTRLCAGNKLAKLQLAILIHHLTIGYKWELLNPDASITYLPVPVPEDGAKMSFSKM